MSDRKLPSSVNAEAWAPIDDELWHGLVHAANNRIASLGGIVQLHEHKISTPEEGMRALSDEVARLRALMLKFRALTVSRKEQREIARIAHGLTTAVGLLAHHSVGRNWVITVTDEPPGVEPVSLWPADPLRFALLLLLAAGAGRQEASFFVTFADCDGMTEVSVMGENASAAVEASAAYAALSAAATAEGGQLQCTMLSPEQVELRLALPGLTRAAQRQA